MAKNPKKAAATIVMVTLAEIVAAGAEGIYTHPEVHEPLVEAGLVEINSTAVNEAGEIATRATQKGIDSMNEIKPAATPAKVKSTFVVATSVPVPVVTGRGRTSGSSYPFDDLEVGQSFFVPNTEKRPNAAKSLASTVSSATARHSYVDPTGATKLNRKGATVPVMIETRKFVVRGELDGAPWDQPGVIGAGVWRDQ